ncbi:hypothetical protein [Lichenifustis flavocetrariae]|uniref:Uncharacterized protein n=1 Tax=Lichenifustis flavocetrariae TaxID=2949735 RepID=A0AA41Z565_9HYPH|nr:hypothetical protein [Lichenifustis flavocetrariae]MCW6513226.1 hypothetical protein [Lichenifustis flavocetrariae]
MNKISLAALPFAMIAIVSGSHAKAAEAPAASPAATVPAPPADFSIDQVPLSNAPLGKFPFFGLPPDYVPQNTTKAPQFGHFLFWTGKALKDVEGETFMVTIVAKPDGKEFSSYVLKKNMEALFQQAGAVKISDGKIPDDALKTIPDDVRGDLIMGLGDVWNNPAET